MNTMWLQSAAGQLGNKVFRIGNRSCAGRGPGSRAREAVVFRAEHRGLSFPVWGILGSGQRLPGHTRGRKPWPESGETGRGLCPAWGNAVRCDDRCSALRWLMQCTAMAHAARCDLMGIAERQAWDGCGVVRLASCPLARTAEKQAGHNGRMGCKAGSGAERNVMASDWNCGG